MNLMNQIIFIEKIKFNPKELHIDEGYEEI